MFLPIEEPTQSCLEPLSQCVRLSLETGNHDFGHSSPVYYLMWSFSSGNNIKVVSDDLLICVRQLGSNFGNDSSFKTPSYTLFLQFFFTPLFNILRDLEGDELCLTRQGTSFPFDEVQLVNNYDILKAATELERFIFIILILIMHAPFEFMSRNLDKALEFANMNYDFFLVSQEWYNVLELVLCDLIEPSPLLL